jgi:hypothetical protein
MLDKLAGNTYVHVAALVLLALLAYSNTFDVPFLYDDIRFIKDNPLIKDFGYFTNPSSTEDMHVSEDVKRYFKSRYVGNLSLWANYKLGGLDVRGFHVVNLALHIINSLLVYLLVVLTFRTPLLDGSKLQGCFLRFTRFRPRPLHTSFRGLSLLRLCSTFFPQPHMQAQGFPPGVQKDTGFMRWPY